IIRSLWRELPVLIDKAVPNIDIDNSCLLRLAAVEFVEISRIGTRLRATLGGQANPDDRNAGALQCRDGGVDALDVSELPLFRLEFPRSVGRLARLCGRRVAMLLLDRRRRRWDWRGRLYRLRVRWRGRRSLLTDSLAIIVSDHHDDEFGFLGSDDLARHLRPFAIAAPIVADETGIGAMFAHDADFGLLGKSIFEPVGKPVSVRITHHHDLDRGILAQRGWRRVGVIRRLVLLDFSGPLPLLFPLVVGGGPFPLAITPVAPLAIAPEAPIGIVRLLRIRIVRLPRIRIVRLLRLLLAPAPGISPELRVGWKQKSKAQHSRCCRSDNETRRRARVRCHWSSLRVEEPVLRSTYVAAFRSVAAARPPSLRCVAL